MSAPAVQTCNDRRVDLRQFIDLPPVLLVSEAITEQIQIVNLARRGFLARAMLAYNTGETVTLRLNAELSCEARIVWSAKGMVGGRFVVPFDYSLLGMIADNDLAGPE